MQSNSTKRNLLTHTHSISLRALILLGLGILPTSNTWALKPGTPAVPAKKNPIELKSSAVRSDRPLAFKNWGILNKQDKSDIQAVDAWKLEQGRKDIVVAVIDTGVDAGHPDLRANIWDGTTNHPTKAGLFGGVSGYGWNFVKDNDTPGDDHGHGTHVAGIIGAVANPETGVSGVAQHVSIMAVKYYSETASGTVNLANTIKAIDFAVKNGARIINYSGGGPEFSEEEYLAIRRAEVAGVLVVAAAGNEHQDTDQVENYYYPSAYRLSNILSVAATDIHNRLIRSSNWGARRVDVAAPGENIYSTLPGGKYGYMTGTSQATAFVTGVAALLLSKNPKLTPVELKKLILENVDRFPTLVGKVATAGRVNAFKALNALNRRMHSSSNGLARATPESDSLQARTLAAQPLEASSR